MSILGTYSPFHYLQIPINYNLSKKYSLIPKFNSLLSLSEVAYEKTYVPSRKKRGFTQAQTAIDWTDFLGSFNVREAHDVVVGILSFWNKNPFSQLVYTGRNVLSE